MKSVSDSRIGVVGLGYVGLPLAVAFGRKMPTVGFDINAARVKELESGVDSTLECDAEELAAADKLSYSANPESLADCNVLIATVPTPIDAHNRPDLTPLEKASETIGTHTSSVAPG